MTRSSYAGGQLNRRAARTHGGAECVGPPCDGGDTPRYSRAWRSGAAGWLRPALAGGDPAAPLPNSLERAAEAVRDQAAAGLLPFDPWPRPLPRQRLLP